MTIRAALTALLVWSSAGASYAQSPVAYRVSFPEAQHHRMQVEVTFPDVPPGTLEVMMSRTSPGRYAVHEFARNVYDVQIDDGSGGPLGIERPNPSQWSVAGTSRHVCASATRCSAIISTAPTSRSIPRTRT